MTTEEICVHRWIVETPQGPQVRGVCLKCGEERFFSSSLSETWTDPQHRTRKHIELQDVD
jgi:hypothetical protein